MSAQTTVIAETIQSGYSPTALPADPCAIVIFGAPLPAKDSPRRTCPTQSVIARI